TRSDITMVLDEQCRVIWQSFHSTRLLGIEPPQSVTPPHVFEHLRSSGVLPVIRRMLETNTAQGESLIHQDDGEHILEVELQALDDLRDLPNAQLLFVRDVTTLRVRSNLEERRRELLMVSAISADIASSLDVAQIIDRAVQQTLTVNNADIVSVYVLDDGKSGPLRREKCHGDPDVVALIPETLPLEDTIAGRAVRDNQTVIITDAQDGGSLSERLIERGLRAAITIPLAVHDHVVGVLQFGYRTRREFDMVQVALLESVGRQLAIALDNARLYRQELEQRKLAEVLRQVASTMATPPLHEALTTILGLLRELIDYERASVLLVDTPGCLRIGAQQGFVIDPEAVPLDLTRIDIADYPYLVRLFDERTAQIVSDIPSDHEWKTNEFRYNSWMGVPLISHDQVIGCISITHQSAGQLTEHDLRIATIFANQTAMVVENARLFETEQRRRVYAEQLQKTSYELVTSRSLDAALSTVLVRLKDLLEFDRANIGLINESQQVWVAYTSHPAGTLPVSTIPLANNPLMNQIVETKSPVLIHDTQASASSITQQAMWSEARSWMGLPLVVRDRVIGILSVYRVQPRGFSDEQFQIARTFANQVAAAFENFRLLEEANRQNRALSALNMVLSVSNEALTHENLLGVLLERVLDTLNLKYGVIHQYYVGSHELRLRAVSGLPVALVDPLNHIPALGLQDVTLPPIALPGGERYIFFSVPLVSHRVEIGLLSVSSGTAEPLSPILKTLLTNIGQQLGVVMDNAILFDETARRVTLSTDLGRLSLAISAQLERDAVLDLICRESLGVFDVQGAYIWLVNDQQLVGKMASGLGADRFAGYTLSLQESHLLPVRVLGEWRPRYINDIGNKRILPAEFVEMTHARSVMAVPLVRADVPTGVLLLVNVQDSQAFGDWQTEQAGLFGVQIALALQNASLFEEVRHRLDQLRLVNEVGRYTIAILSPSMLVDGVARQLYGLLGYDTISVLHLEEGELKVVTVFVRGQPFPTDLPAERYASLQTAAKQAIQQSEPVILNQVCYLQPDIPHLSEP
ncbi:MAG: GAF domain-containing protein, partial [Chloroflexi bacterium]|nr:GAF domain-containing protein [Chloroflexota bacterium]